ncbi:hypothetical protein M7I_6312 [Glarea lozoyensis 74030]|uniref:Uncharacterized protein n=1 Tax=Glarea lozoyensis (strain ATCC 74030 / MF5533) TaxID=1104152 RepID=H0EU81_GLAL7|nr:hypothetical protein M7I_6312 [Glarea lozoyensis 74030]
MLPRARRERGSKSSTPRPSKPNTYQPILSILKKADLQDELPEFAVVNVEIWARDGSQMMNLMDSNLRGGFKIYGSLRLTKEQNKYYCKGARNGPYDFETEITSYAIDANPQAQIWVGTVCGWLYIQQPSEQYAAILADTATSVSLLYQCIDLEDEIKEEKRPLKVEDFLFEPSRMHNNDNEF